MCTRVHIYQNAANHSLGRTIEDVSKLVSLAEAARIYAREAELGLEAQNYAAEIKLRAQRKGGEILKRMEKRKGGNASTELLSQPVTATIPKLIDLGIGRMDSSRWQRIAQIPEALLKTLLVVTPSRRRDGVRDIICNVGC